MILVADSGSTKTTWAETSTGIKTVTEGLNPHFSTDGQLLEACRTVRSFFLTHSDKGNAETVSIFFYGAGCGDEMQRTRLTKLLQQGFSAVSVEVNTDMLGACRAVSSDKASIVGILGTGSNSCYFDGREILFRTPSLGYLLGDEGSANHLGRIILDDYMKGKMTEEVKELFHEAYPYSYTEWMDHIYHRPNANRFLASLARFAVDHIGFTECENNIWYVVDKWHSEQLCSLIIQSHCSKINVIGSFGKAIEKTLRGTLTNYGMEVGTILADPIDGLVEFHRRKED